MVVDGGYGGYSDYGSGEGRCRRAWAPAFLGSRLRAGAPRSQDAPGVGRQHATASPREEDLPLQLPLGKPLALSAPCRVARPSLTS